MLTLILFSGAVGWLLGVITILIIGRIRQKRGLSPALKAQQRLEAQLVAQALIERGLK